MGKFIGYSEFPQFISDVSQTGVEQVDDEDGDDETRQRKREHPVLEMLIVLHRLVQRRLLLGENIVVVHLVFSFVRFRFFTSVGGC